MKASITGNILEKQVQNLFLEKGFEIVMYSKWSKDKDRYGNELLLRHVPYESIYNHKGYTEFLLSSKKYNKQIRIECKWQQTPGSVDEKLPYLFLNATKKMNENEIMIIIDGKGWKKGAIPWLKEAVSSSNQSERINVLSLTEFLTWANKFF
tara:strand:+ start:1179 stop:1634 length:456 start_codon:yes stop_codon:yes gene_type:complete